MLAKQLSRLTVCVKKDALAALIKDGKCSMGHLLATKPTSSIGSGGSRKCDVRSGACTKKDFSDEEIQWYHCSICEWDVCPGCAARVNQRGVSVRLGDGSGSGGFTGIPSSAIFYCGKKKDECKCGGCDGRCGPNNGCPCADCYSLISHTQPQVGDRVRVKKSVSEPEYGWGEVKHKSSGILTRIDDDGDVIVAFPAQSSWRGLLGEIEKDDRKFVKGNRVKLAADYKDHSDAKDGPLKPGFSVCERERERGREG